MEWAWTMHLCHCSSYIVFPKAVFNIIDICTCVHESWNHEQETMAHSEHLGNGGLCINVLRAKKFCFCFWLLHLNWYHLRQPMELEKKKMLLYFLGVDTKLTIVVQLMRMVNFTSTTKSITKTWSIFFICSCLGAAENLAMVWVAYTSHQISLMWLPTVHNQSAFGT